MRRIAAILAGVVLALSSGSAGAAVPRTISYQGLLLGSAGAPVPDGSYGLTFRIYSAASGGAALWTEGQPSVSASKGVFSVVLGSVTPINLAFDVPYYLGVTIGANPELVPRTALNSSAYSNTARDIELPWSKFQGSSGTLAVIVNSLAGGGGALSLEANSSSLSTPVLTVINNFATGGYGLHSVVHVSGPNPAAGVYSEVVGSGGAGTAGVVGVSPSNYGVDGESTTGTGVLGRSGSGAGISGTTGLGQNSSNAAAVIGTNVSTGAGGYGVYASHSGAGSAVYATSAAGTAVRAITYGTASNTQAVHGEISTTQNVTGSVGVEGENFCTSNAGYGVEGYHHTTGLGVYGHTDGGGEGVKGTSTGVGGVAIYGAAQVGAVAGRFDGNVTVTGSMSVSGTVSKTSGSFKIDHPLDPANKYLYHSFVESPDMKNIYDGVVTTDEKGEAVVALPDYFEALNKDFRYQLTAVDQPAQVWVSEEIHGNMFRVSSDIPRATISWQVTGVRHDAAALAHPMVVEVPKSPSELGKYLDPKAFHEPAALGLDYAGRIQTRLQPEGGGK